MLLVAGALAGARAINELVIESFGEVGPAILHISGERDYPVASRPGAARRLPPDPVDRPDRRRLLRRRPRAGAGGQLGLGDCGGGQAGDPRPLSVRDGDHQAKNAEHFVRAGGAIMVRELDLDDVPDHVRSLLDDAPRLERMAEAMRHAAKPDAADEIAEGLIALAAA